MSITSKDGKSFHVGMVVATVTRHDVRIMSDVWANVTYAVVYQPTGEENIEDSFRYHTTPWKEFYKLDQGMFTFVRLSCSEFGMNSNVQGYNIDASPEIQEIYQAWLRGKDFASKLHVYDSDEWRIQEGRRRVEPGRFARVVKGRKVPKGTVGKIFWVGDKGYGPCVGLALPSDDGVIRGKEITTKYGKKITSYEKTVFVASSYVAVTDGLDGRVL